MKNYEKYADEIRKYDGDDFCCSFIRPHILKTDNCSDMPCSRCQMLQTLWLLEDCEESEIDWSKVEVDTPLLVRKYKNGEWSKRYFAKYEDGKVYTWYNGRTSWNETSMYAWDYAKLAEPEVDWSKVKVDTAIYVKASKYGNWFKRHFAEYKNGKIYTWGNGLTSHDTSRMMEWKYAKLVESEEPEVDWNKVEVDTPILVKYSEKGMWIRRKFAKFEDGVVYAWHGKETGHSKNYMTPWNYAKLAESERKDNISESNANNRR